MLICFFTTVWFIYFDLLCDLVRTSVCWTFSANYHDSCESNMSHIRNIHTKNIYWKHEDIVFVFGLLCIPFSLKELSNIEFTILFSHKSLSIELNLCVHFWLSKLRSIHVCRMKGVESVKIVERVRNERRSGSDNDSS